MRKRLTVLICALALSLFSVPLFSGCSAQTVYTLCGDEESGYYYSVGYSGFASSVKGELIIPAYYGEGEYRAPVKEIAGEGFAGTAITKAVIPETVEKIGVAAFAYCYSLKEVEFAEGFAMGEIPQSMFAYCSSLTRIVIPQSVTVIQTYAFFTCSALAEVTLPDGLQAIGPRVFQSCSALETITFPENLTTIGYLAFYMAGLTSVVIPDSVKDTYIETTDDDGNTQTTTLAGIGYAAFHTCTALKTAKVGTGTTELRAGVFGYCTSLESVYLPASLEKIEGALYSGGEFVYGHAFHNNTSLTDVYYGGTQAQWEELLKNTDNVAVTENKSNFDNSAIVNATVHCETVYNG